MIDIDFTSAPFAIFFGILAPILISFLKEKGWSTEAKTLASLGVSLVAGLILVFMEGNFSSEKVLETWAIVFTTATAFYKMYFENTDFNKSLMSKSLYKKSARKE